MTNKLIQRTTEEIMTGFVPTYAPIMPLFMARSKQHVAEVGDVTFKQAKTIGDIRARIFTPKDTVMHQVQVGEGKKAFKKYFRAAQFTQSNLQNQEGYEETVAEVLDEHNKQADEIMLTGDADEAGTPINNGLYFSSDENYTLRSSVQIVKDSNGNHLSELYAQVMTQLQVANKTAGRKLVLFYGDATIAKTNGLFVETKTSFLKVLTDAAPGVSIATLPSEVTPAGAEGYMIINLDKITLHYITLPKVDDQGENKEKKYLWTNFLMGSSSVEVNAKNGVIRQPLTFQA